MLVIFVNVNNSVTIPDSDWFSKQMHNYLYIYSIFIVINFITSYYQSSRDTKSPPQFWWTLLKQTPYRSGGFDCFELLLRWDWALALSEVVFGVVSDVSSSLEFSNSSSWLGSLFKSRWFLLTTPVDVRTWYVFGPSSSSTSPEPPGSDIYASSPDSKTGYSDALCLLS